MGLSRVRTTTAKEARTFGADAVHHSHWRDLLPNVDPEVRSEVPADVGHVERMFQPLSTAPSTFL